MPSHVNRQAQWVDYLKNVDTPTLSNAIEAFRLRSRSDGFTSYHIRSLFPEFGRMVGYAVTAEVETMTEGQTDSSKAFCLYEAVLASPKPAVVAYQEIGPRPNYAAHCGEVMATIFKRLGAVGLVTDCAVRDIAEVRAMGFQYFARGGVASHSHFRIVRVGVPIQVQNLVIHPHDLLHGDENGLILVPSEALHKLASEVEAVRIKERAVMEFVRGPNFTLEKLRKFV